MPQYNRVFIKGGTYFFTVVTYQRHPVFQHEKEVNSFLKCLDLTKQDYPFGVEAIVILPDHIHTIWTLPVEDDDFSTRWRIIKRRFGYFYKPLNNTLITSSMKNKQEQGIWQRRFWEHLIRDEEDFNLHCDYIHYNPVKHNLVKSPGFWKFSSFNKFFNRGFYPANWGSDIPGRLTGIDLE